MWVWDGPGQKRVQQFWGCWGKYVKDEDLSTNHWYYWIYWLCGSISEYVSYIIWIKTQGYVIYPYELTFFYERVNDALVTRDRSEVVEPVSEHIEMLQLQRILGVSASLALRNHSIKSWKNWTEWSYLSWYLGEYISKESCPTETESHRLRVAVSELQDASLCKDDIMQVGWFGTTPTS